MRQSIAVIEQLEDRRLLTAGPTATFLQYVKGSGSSRTFAILYEGPQAIGRATLDSGDILVTSDQDSIASVKFIGAAKHVPGNGLIAQYRIDGVTSGLYSIELTPQTVSDTNGNFVPAGLIGSFKIGPKGQATFDTALPPSIAVLGTTHGSSEFPPAIDTSFGPVVRAVNFGGDAMSVPGSTGTTVNFDSQHATLGAKKKHPRGSLASIQISFTAAVGNVYEAIVGDNPLFETEIFSGSQSDEKMAITGLDPTRQYEIQFLHGDIRPEEPYVSTQQIFSLANSKFATTNLEFNTSEETKDSNTAILVGGTTAVYYNMPPCPTRGPSFSGVVIEMADVATPGGAPAPTFVKSSQKIAGTGQLFDVSYGPGNDISAQSLAAPTLQVSGPNGFSAVASLLQEATSENGSVIATYRIEGIDLTGTYTISLGGKKIGASTFFHLRPIIWF